MRLGEVSQGIFILICRRLRLTCNWASAILYRYCLIDQHLDLLSYCLRSQVRPRFLFVSINTSARPRSTYDCERIAFTGDTCTINATACTFFLDIPTQQHSLRDNGPSNDSVQFSNRYRNRVRSRSEYRWTAILNIHRNPAVSDHSRSSSPQLERCKQRRRVQHCLTFAGRFESGRTNKAVHQRQVRSEGARCIRQACQNRAVQTQKPGEIIIIITQAEGRIALLTPWKSCSNQ
jgi:hypothetical protein